MIHRRNNAVGGIFILVGSILIAFGAVLPWIEVRSGALGIGAGPVELQAAYRSAIDVGEAPSIVQGLGVFTGLVALGLIATRIRGLGVMLRVGALAGLVFPAFIVAAAWTAVLKPPDNKMQSLLQASGLLTTEAGQGLYVLSIGSALVLVGSFIPAIRSSQAVALVPPPRQHPRRDEYEVPPDWYPVEGGYRYWDGRAWTEHFEQGQ